MLTTIAWLDSRPEKQPPRQERQDAPDVFTPDDIVSYYVSTITVFLLKDIL